MKMGAKTLMIQEDVYNELKRLKKANESFTDVIRRLIQNHQDLSPFYGILTEEEGNIIENAIEKTRMELDQADLERDAQVFTDTENP